MGRQGLRLAVSAQAAKTDWVVYKQHASTPHSSGGWEFKIKAPVAVKVRQVKTTSLSSLCAGSSQSRGRESEQAQVFLFLQRH